MKLPGLILTGVTFALAVQSTGAVSAERQSDALPPTNRYLAASQNSILHGNPAQTKASSTPGPTGPTRTLGSQDIIWHGIGPNDGFSIQYSGIYPDGGRVAWVGGTQLLAKIDASSFDILSTYSLGTGKFWTSTEIEQLFRKADRLSGQPLFDVLVPPMANAIERGVQATYRLLNSDNEIVMLRTDPDTRDQIVQRYGDSIKGDRHSDIALLGELNLTKSAKLKGYSLALNMT